MWYSINYDRILNQKERVSLSGRAGISYSSFFGRNNVITLPITASFLIGNNEKFLEVSGGPTLHYVSSEKTNGIIIMGLIGFRYQPMEEKGIMYRITLNPFLAKHSNDKDYMDWYPNFWFGISFGFIF